MQSWFAARHPKPPGDSDFVWRQSVRAKAFDALRGLLPAGATSNLGIYASGQAYEALLIRMRAHALARGPGLRRPDADRAAQGDPVVGEAGRRRRPGRGPLASTWSATTAHAGPGRRPLRRCRSRPPVPAARPVASVGEPAARPVASVGSRRRGRWHRSGSRRRGGWHRSGRRSGGHPAGLGSRRRDQDRGRHAVPLHPPPRASHPGAGGGHVGRGAPGGGAQRTSGSGPIGATVRAGPWSGATIASTSSPTTGPSGTCNVTGCSPWNGRT